MTIEKQRPAEAGRLLCSIPRSFKSDQYDECNISKSHSIICQKLENMLTITMQRKLSFHRFDELKLNQDSSDPMICC